jgi:hypothetical protein
MRNKKTQGRNDPCWCGSGKKFKKCHWPDIAATPQSIAGISYFDEADLTETLKQMMAIDFENLDVNDLKSSKNYLLQKLQNNVIPDVRDPDREDYMIFAPILEAHISAKESDKEVTKFYKQLYKAVLKSEKNFNYQLYKGHILVKLATVSLITEPNLDVIVDLLNRAQQQDIKFGYKNPTYRPAYKILSFLQPLLTFRDRLWPSDEDVRKKVGTRLNIVLYMNKASVSIAMGKDALKNDVRECIKDNKALLDIIEDNIDELFETMMLCDKNTKFYKSGMFLVGNIVEGVLYNLSLNAKSAASDSKEINLEKASIEKLAKFLRQNGIINNSTEYLCRFIQHYRDFIHPVRNLKHEYLLNHNFNKMFLFFLMLLLGDLQKSSEKLVLSDLAPAAEE